MQLVACDLCHVESCGGNPSGRFMASTEVKSSCNITMPIRVLQQILVHTAKTDNGVWSQSEVFVEAQ